MAQIAQIAPADGGRNGDDEIATPRLRQGSQ
jgi:hypothetical protein